MRSVFEAVDSKHLLYGSNLLLELRRTELGKEKLCCVLKKRVLGWKVIPFFISGVFDQSNED